MWCTLPQPPQLLGDSAALDRTVNVSSVKPYRASVRNSVAFDLYQSRIFLTADVSSYDDACSDPRPQDSSLLPAAAHTAVKSQSVSPAS